MKLKFDVSTQELLIIQQVLQYALPQNCKVWVFGSRAKHQAKFNSDLDLAFECQLPLDKATLRKLNEAFDESHLPYSVDVVDMHKVSKDFKKIIDQQKIVFPLKANVPKLRFSSFNKTGWSQSRLSKLARVIDCKHRTPPYIENGVPVVSPGTIVWGELDLDSPKKHVSEEEYESLMNHCSVKSGDLVFSRNQSLGVASYVLKKSKFVLGQDTVLIQSKNDLFFIYFYFQNRNLQNQIERLSGGSTFSRINLKDIRELVISYPSDIQEQQKIADFLTAVDQRIQLLERKHKLLKDYKKGVMQQIFTQKLRFKDEQGHAYPDWEEKRLGEVLIGDILLSMTGNVGRVCLVNEINCLLNQRVGKLIPFQINKIFLYQILQTQLFQSSMQAKAKGAAQENISIADIMLYKFNSPTSFPEQQKIADFLTAIDTKIEHTHSQLEKTKLFKKVLLQQMFV